MKTITLFAGSIAALSATLIPAEVLLIADALSMERLKVAGQLLAYPEADEWVIPNR